MDFDSHTGGQVCPDWLVWRWWVYAFRVCVSLYVHVVHVPVGEVGCVVYGVVAIG